MTDKTKTWFITGAASGFGRRMAELLLARGDRVAATDRRPETLADLDRQYGDRSWSAALDVTDTAAMRAVVAAAFARFGRIDVVVSNAGYGLFGAAEEATDDMVEHQIRTNLLASIQLARAVIPYLRQQGGGRIMQMASSGGQVADPGMSVYNATKWGIEGFFESAMMELAPFGITATLVEPGGSRTGFLRAMATTTPLDAYQDGIVGRTRQVLTGDPDSEVVRQSLRGDPVKIAQAIIACADEEPAPKRLTLGSTAYTQISAALRDRLAQLEAKRALAYSVDADDIIAARTSRLKEHRHSFFLSSGGH
jgi:NAD(P)-dependent dehydrogenase (short-subunit alcohol dehydrogenase family)